MSQYLKISKLFLRNLLRVLSTYRLKRVKVSRCAYQQTVEARRVAHIWTIVGRLNIRVPWHTFEVLLQSVPHTSISSGLCFCKINTAKSAANQPIRRASGTKQKISSAVRSTPELLVLPHLHYLGTFNGICKHDRSALFSWWLQAVVSIGGPLGIPLWSGERKLATSDHYLFLFLYLSKWARYCMRT